MCLVGSPEDKISDVCACVLQVSGKGAMADAEKYAKYTQNNTVKEKKIVDAPYHSTLCSTCQTVCHDHCGLTEITAKGTLQCSLLEVIPVHVSAVSTSFA